MDLPKISLREGGVLSGIKSKLGFSNDKDDSFDDEYDYDDEYDDEYEQDNYVDGYSDVPYRDNTRSGYETSTPRARAYYDNTRPEITSRPSGGSIRSVSSNLVNIDDVRARTRVPETLMRDPLNGSQVRSMYGQGVAGLYQINPEPVESFTPVASTTQTPSYDALRTGFDPYDAFSGAGESTHAPSRSLSVLKPISYGEVEQVARYLRAGDMVVLSLKNISSDLAKRILDFSFGAASMVDARVECVADKVFALSTGVALTDAEKTRLISQGIM